MILWSISNRDSAVMTSFDASSSSATTAAGGGGGGGGAGGGGGGGGTVNDLPITLTRNKGSWNNNYNQSNSAQTSPMKNTTMQYSSMSKPSCRRDKKKTATNNHNNNNNLLTRVNEDWLMKDAEERITSKSDKKVS
jgi:archaellin